MNDELKNNSAFSTHHSSLFSGFSYSADELDTALSGFVAGVVYDDSGKADIEALLAGLAETNFEKGAEL